jgi:hypothetical protein
VRLYRITQNDPPNERDMLSHWDLGRRPALAGGEGAYKEVSTFDTLERAASKAIARGLGDYIAELEIPERHADVAERPDRALRSAGNDTGAALGLRPEGPPRGRDSWRPRARR